MEMRASWLKAALLLSFFLSFAIEAFSFQIIPYIVPRPRILKLPNLGIPSRPTFSQASPVRLQAQPRHREDGFTPGNVLTKAQYNAKPLSLKEEVHLGLQIKLGRVIQNEQNKYIAENGTEPSLAFLAERFNSTEETIETSLNNMRAAKELLVLSNQKLVVHIAKFYRYRGVPFGVLMKDATSGLIKALDKYEPEKGFKFSTYAAWWVKMACTRCVAEKSRIVRLPIHVHDLLITLERIYEELTNKFFRDPTNEEIADRMAIPVKKVDFLMTQRTTVIGMETNVYQEKLGKKDKEVKYKDIIPTLEPNPLAFATTNGRKDLVLSALDGLTEREREIIILRFGLNGVKKLTLDDIGDRFGITRERVRQIENRILAKLRLDLKEDKVVKTALCDELWNDEFAEQKVAPVKTRRRRVKSSPPTSMLEVCIPSCSIESLLAE